MGSTNIIKNRAETNEWQIWQKKLMEIFQKNPALETWPGHCEARQTEIQALLPFLKQGGISLELGCGNAYVSAALCPIFEKIIACDLREENPTIHSTGLEKAYSLLEKLDEKKLSIAETDGKSIPFPNLSFDTIFTIYVLHHIADRHRTMQEIHRTLKNDGIFLACVPGALWSFLYFFTFYFELGKKVFKKILEKKKGEAQHQKEKGEAKHQKNLWAAYPHFPAPEPHGAYSSYWKELVEYQHSHWKRFFEHHRFEIIDVSPITFIPKDTILSLCGNRLGKIIINSLASLDQALLRQPAIKPFAQTYLAILKKQPHG